MPAPSPASAARCLLVAAGACAALAPGVAEAGAWTRPPGNLQLITTAGRHGAPLRAGEDEDADTDIVQAYAEYGLLEGLTVGAKFWTDFAPGDPSVGSAALGGFVRKRLWRTDSGHVASVQLGALAPVESWLNEEFGESKPFSAAEVEARALYGKSWWGDWGSAFVSTEAGYQVRLEGLPDEIRADATLGIEPFDCCMAMLGIYGLQPIGEGLTDESLRLAPSIAWHLRRPDADDPDRRRTSLQLGVTYDALQPEDGFGVFLGIWQEFQF